MVSSPENSRANALIHETSPYLLQHAHNPVDWRPWGAEAIAAAKAENKLIFLSIGYAACHWCHVMEHESFEDREIAALLNRDYVSVKVDREERPDLDEIYMSATMLYTGGHGGWPMSVFLAPDLRPVYAGTYFPKDDMYGRPGFRSVLTQLAGLWKEKGDEMARGSDRVVEAVRQIHASGEAGEIVSRFAVSEQAEKLLEAFDPATGGVPSGPNKFPPSQALDLFLREWHDKGNRRYLDMTELTLEKMGNGGIYDHLGGGIARYSTDPKWLVPHFEKMLYDQALVSGIYVDACQTATTAERKALFAEKAKGIFDYVLNDLTSPEGAFYSSEDADSEGLEGKFYIWTREEVDELLGADDARVVSRYYDITPTGNWMHPGDAHVPHGPKTVLQVLRDVATIAALEEKPADEIEAILERGRSALLAARDKRVRPGLDDKVLAGWNGLMIAAMAKGGAVLGDSAYVEAASRAADFLLENVRDGARLLATYGKGKARLTAYATDYAFLIEGLLAVYEATGTLRWLMEADALTAVMNEHYWDAGDGAYFFTADDHEELLVRSKTAQDGAIPSANSVMLHNLLKLAVLRDKPEYRQRAEQIIRVCAGSGTMRSPHQAERLMAGVEMFHEGLDEVVLVRPAGATDWGELLPAVHAVYHPNKVIVLATAGEGAEELGPLLAGREALDGKPTAYVCREFACQQPVNAAASLRDQLTPPRERRPTES